MTAAALPPSNHTPGNGPQGSRKTGGSALRWWTLGIILALIVAGVYVGCSYIASKKAAVSSAPDSQKSGNGGKGEGGGRPVPVVGVESTRGDLPVYLDAVGTVTAFNSVTLHTRVDGQLIQVPFKEGEMVKVGDLMAEVDPRPFEVQLAQAQGQKAKDESALQNARLDLQRYETAKEAVPQQQLDTAAAQVSQNEAAVKIDDAAIDAANLQLTYTKITAPIPGRVGLRNVDVGNIVHATDTMGLAMITQVQPISVVFSLAQDTLPQVEKAMHDEKDVPSLAYDPTLTRKLATGTLGALDNAIDVSSGTYRLKATFQNEDNSLYPNQFVNVRLLVDTHKDVVLVSSVAIQRSPESTYVFVVRDDNTAEMRNVTPGDEEAGLTEVTEGLEPGEKVVTLGLDQLKEGTKVQFRLQGAQTRSATSTTTTSGPTTQKATSRRSGRGR